MKTDSVSAGAPPPSITNLPLSARLCFRSLSSADPIALAISCAPAAAAAVADELLLLLVVMVLYLPEKARPARARTRPSERAEAAGRGDRISRP